MFPLPRFDLPHTFPPSAAPLFQHEETIDILATGFKTPEGGLKIPWNSYGDFWLELPSVLSNTRDIVETALTLEDLVTLSSEKVFWQSLKGEGVPPLRAKAITNLIHTKVYQKR